MTDVPIRAPLSALVGSKRCCDLPADRMASILHALAHPVRLRILKQIKTGGITLSSLTRVLALTRDQTMRHIVFLRQAGLIGSARQDGTPFYRSVPQRCSAVEDLVELTLQFIDVPSENVQKGKRIP
jgi:DNA-binding transcriptional ArsR family regulator